MATIDVSNNGTLSLVADPIGSPSLTNSTNNSSRLNTLIASLIETSPAGGATLYFPSPSSAQHAYYFRNQVTIDNSGSGYDDLLRLDFVGDGMNATQLMENFGTVTYNQALFWFQGIGTGGTVEAPPMGYFSIQNMRFFGGLGTTVQQNASYAALRFTNQNNVLVENVAIQSWGTGIEVEGSYEMTQINCAIQSCLIGYSATGNNGVLNAPSAPVALTFVNCELSDNYWMGFIAREAGNVTFVSGSINFNGANNYPIANPFTNQSGGAVILNANQSNPNPLAMNALWGASFVGVQFENNYSNADLYVTGGGSNSFELDTGYLVSGCTFIRDIAANDPLAVANTTTATSMGGTVLTFSATPTAVVAGLQVLDVTSNPPAIGAGTTVSSIASNTVTLSAGVAATVNSGDTIGFYDNPQLIARTDTITNAGTAVLNFGTASAPGVTVGFPVANATHPASIPTGTTVAAISGGSVTMSANALSTISNGDSIYFTVQPAQNFISLNLGSITSTNKTALAILGNSFGAAVAYTPSSSRPYIAVSGSSPYQITDWGNTYKALVENPQLSGPVEGAGGLCSSSVVFDGLTATIIGTGYNVASVTRGGTGLYTINYQRALTTSQPVIVGTVAPNSSGTPGIVQAWSATDSSVTVQCYNLSGTATDFEYVSVVTYGGNKLLQGT